MLGADDRFDWVKVNFFQLNVIIENKNHIH